MNSELVQVIRHSGLRSVTISLLLLGLTFASTNPYLSIVALEQLGMTPQAYGVVLLASTIATTFSVVVIGHMSDQIRNRKTLILISLAMGWIGFGFFALLPTGFTFVFCLLIAAPLSMSAFPQLFAVVRTLAMEIRADRAPQVNSAVRAIYALSWILVPGFVGGLIARSGRISDAFAIASFAYFFCFWFYVLFGPNVHRADQDQASGVTGLLDAFRLIIGGPILVRVSALSTIGLVHPINATLVPLIILEMEGGSAKHIGIVAGLVAALEIPFMILGGTLSRKFGLFWIIFSGGLIHAVYVVALIFSSDLTHIYLLSVLNAAGAAVLLSLHLSYFQEYLPDRPGLATSLFSIELLIQRALAAGIVAGVGLLFGHSVALMIAAFGVGIGLSMLVMCPRKTPPV